MLKDRIRHYYLEMDYNCAESMLLAANDEYQLAIDAEACKLLGGFGGGMGCQHTCGALCGAIAVIGKKYITQRAHATEDLKLLCASFVARFRQALGTDSCAALRERFFAKDARCLAVVLRAGELLETLLRDYEAGNLR